MKVFIVFSHPEKKSFNGALYDTACDVLKDGGHEVACSDLYGMGFNPVGGPDEFEIRKNPEFFKYSHEQEHAVSEDILSKDIEEEQRKLMECDLLIVQFPFWWYGFPAILKGWVDRVITRGNLYNEVSIYSRGVLKGKRVLLSMTTGGTPNPTVSHSDIEQILRFYTHGIFYFLGMDVVKPNIIYSPSRMTEKEREDEIKKYREFLQNIETAPLESFEPVGENQLLECSKIKT